jgi:hypothetical protein
MGIDGIGKPGAGIPSPVGSNQGSERAGATEPFRTDAPAAASSVAGSEELGRLESGEISVEQYLDSRVEDAVSHLVNKLSAAELQFVRETLREQLSTDPVLVDLVRRTTA